MIHLETNKERLLYERILDQSSVARRALIFTGCLVVVGILCAAVGLAVAGSRGLEAAAWATGLCLIPGWVVFLCEPLYRLPRLAMANALISSGLRLGVTLGGSVALLAIRPDMPPHVFLGCMFVQYLTALILETVILLRAMNAKALLQALGLA